jgi:hypothetical protein
MTLCIAAHCTHNDEPALVLCSDMQGTDFVKSDDTQKVRVIRHSASIALISGTISAALEMITRVSDPLRDFTADDKNPVDFDPRLSKLLASLRAVARKRIEEKVEHYLGTTYSLSTAAFYSNLNAMPPADFSRVLGEIRRIDLDCDLIIANMTEEDPIIVLLTANGDVSLQENYSCIGSCYVLARSVLCQQRWRTDMGIMDCAARVLSAKWAAEKDPHVGNGTHLVVMRPGKQPCNLSAEGKKAAEAGATRIRFKSGLEMKDEYFGLAPTE